MPSSAERVTAWLYRWLPRFFGCHCRADRSFFWHGRQFPICARCTGELVGMLLALATVWWYLPPVWLCALLLLPLTADGLIQHFTRYESTNPRRCMTGILFGYALIALLAISTVWVFHWGCRLGLQLKALRVMQSF